MSLAIGDGANDVNMITAAHVGVGVRGVEGQQVFFKNTFKKKKLFLNIIIIIKKLKQAARASDYAIGEFRLLRRLLFFHGRECYRRNSHLVCYNFYKNILLVLP